MTRDEAISATQNGATAAFFSAGLTVLFVLWAIYSNEQAGQLSFWNDPSNLLDVVLVVGLGLGMRRKSRAAAVTMVIYWIVSKVWISLALGGRPAGLGTGLVFLYFFGQAARGAFVYHRIERDMNPEYKKPSLAWALIGIPVGVLVLGLVAAGIYMETVTPEMMTVVEGSDLSEDTVAELRQAEIVGQEEQIDLFYANGLASVLEGGVVLTQSRVVRYFKDEDDDGGIQIYSLPFSRIGSVTLVEAGNFLNDSV